MKRFAATAWLIALLVPFTMVLAEVPAAEQGFFFSVDIELAADGAGTLRLSYPSNSLMNPKTERDRFTSPVTEVRQIEFNGPLVRTTLAFNDVTRISEAPELRSIVATRRSLEDGRERVDARLRSYLTGNVTSAAPLTINVTFPGPVLEANTKEVKAQTATWRLPAADFFTEQGVVLEAIYRLADQAAVVQRAN